MNTELTSENIFTNRNSFSYDYPKISNVSYHFCHSRRFHNFCIEILFMYLTLLLPRKPISSQWSLSITPESITGRKWVDLNYILWYLERCSRKRLAQACASPSWSCGTRLFWAAVYGYKTSACKYEALTKLFPLFLSFSFESWFYHSIFTSSYKNYNFRQSI